MVLLKLLGLPLTAPVAGLRFTLDKVRELAEQEALDETVVREQLMLLQMQLEEGEIGEEEFAEQEALLFQRLREIRQLKEQRARELRQQSADEDGSLPTGPRRVVVETAFEDDEP